MRCASGFLAVTGGLAALAVSGALAGRALAHQPVMDMAPRWEGGFGAQIRHELRFADDVLDGSDRDSNPDDRERLVNTTWLEGIYTWKREVRFTLKVPWVEQRRDARVDGRTKRQKGSGVGDLIAAVPLRHYWNLTSSTLNVGFTPQLRVPSASTRDDYPVGDGSWDVGLSASASWESVNWYTLADVFWWQNTHGRRGINQGDVTGFDGNLGYHVYHDNERNLGGFVMLDAEVRYEARGSDTGGTTGGTRLNLGPILVGYWHNVMLRGEVKIPVYERVFGTQLARGTVFQLGVGATF